MLPHPVEIGVHLTEGMSMNPAASVSALVLHHPDGTYFPVGDQPGSQQETAIRGV
jgi:cobalamin-dependent methionine synthase I